MLNLQAYMKKAGVTKKHYVAQWLEEDLIPGVIRGQRLEDTLFPEAARRPYRSRWLRPVSTADEVRSHIIKACLTKHHISHKTCYMSAEEFDAMVAELVGLGLVRIRVEDGITYYDSTANSGDYRDRNLREIREFLIDAMESAAKGITEAMLEAV